MEDKFISIGEAAKTLGVTIQTLRNWEEKGILIPKRTPSNHRRYKLSQIKRENFESNKKTEENKKVFLYVRVSTQKQFNEGNLTRQIGRLTEYAIEKGYEVIGVYKDVASGLNENRKGLHQMLDDLQKQQPILILVEFKDRLSRFGCAFIEKYIHQFGTQVLAIEQKEINEEQELVEDLIAITTSFSARIYGKRGGRKVSKTIEKTLKEGEKDENHDSCISTSIE